MRYVIASVALLLLVVLPAVAQKGAQLDTAGQRSPVVGQFRPAPQPSPIRIVALVPVVDIPGSRGAKAPLFLESLHATGDQGPGPTMRQDSSKSWVKSGFTRFRIMYSSDFQWALIDVTAKNPEDLNSIKASSNPAVMVISTEDLTDLKRRSRLQLPDGLSLSEFMEQ